LIVKKYLATSQTPETIKFNLDVIQRREHYYLKKANLCTPKIKRYKCVVLIGLSSISEISLIRDTLTVSSNVVQMTLM
jgi:hypothetical protein